VKKDTYIYNGVLQAFREGGVKKGLFLWLCFLV